MKSNINFPKNPLGQFVHKLCIFIFCDIVVLRWDTLSRQNKYQSVKSPFRGNVQFGPNLAQNCDTLHLMFCSTGRAFFETL